ncbi:MAG: ankyrin repeat domain-containing protein [Bacteroidota bacterium]
MGVNDLSQVQAVVGNNVTVKPAYGLKALLHLAIQEAGEEKLSIAKWLVERAKCYVQQDVLEEAVSNTYYSALERAIIHRQSGILKVLLADIPECIYRGKNARDGITLLDLAAYVGFPPCMQLLVEKTGTDITEQDEDHGIPLHYAAVQGNIECMLYLIEQLKCMGREDLLNATGGEFGFTPLHCLVHSKELKEDGVNLRRVIAALQESKDIRDCKGRTPKDLALSIHGCKISPDLL